MAIRNARASNFDPSQLRPAGQPTTQQYGVSSGDGGGQTITQTPMQGPDGRTYIMQQIDGGQPSYISQGEGGQVVSFQPGSGGQWVEGDFDKRSFGEAVFGDKKLMTFLAVAAGGAAASGAFGGAGAGGVEMSAAGMEGAGYGTAAAAGTTAGGITMGAPAAAGAAGAAAGGAAAGGSTLGSMLSGAGDALNSPAGYNTLAQLLAGAYGANAADKAAQAQLQATREGIAEQRRQYDTSREDLMPWMTAGRETLGQLTGRLPELTSKFEPGDLENDPGYQFELEQGLGAVRGGARGTGTLDSGATLKALMKYGQGLASTKYNEAFNRDQVSKTSIYNMLAGISGTGQATASQVGSFGANTANNVSSLLTQGGNARAGGIVGGANAWTGAAGNIYNGWQQQNTLNQLTRGSNIYGGR